MTEETRNLGGTGGQSEIGHRGAWGPDHAAAWWRWFHIIEESAQGLGARMIELAEIGPGDRVLDVATGLGEPALSVAAAVAPGGGVEAIDASPDMLGFARQRAVAAGLDTIAFRVMAAEALAYPAGRFDAVLCRWGLMFMDDLATTLAGWCACLAPGGRLVAAVWGPPETAPTLSMGARVVRRALGLSPPEEGAKTPFALADVTAFQRTLGEAGFADIRGEWVTVTFTFASAAEFTDFRKDRSGALKAEIAHVPAAEQEAAWQALTTAARDYETADGTIVMDNVAYCVAARRGAGAS